MSSWKKASKTGQKFHKERSQLRERDHLGFLEKKQDYKLRALDYQKKRNLIVDLKRKAQERNPDEFYFNMTKTQLKDGVHSLRNPFKDYTEDELKLMKSQDKNYIKMHYQMEMKKIEKLKDSMILLDVENMPTNQHRFFAENGNEARKFNPVEQFNTHESLMSRKSNRLTKEQLEKLEMPKWVDEEFIKDSVKARERKYKELGKRLNRFESLKKIEQTYDLKPTKINPEQEYDEKFNKQTPVSDGQATKVSKKIVPRKR